MFDLKWTFVFEWYMVGCASKNGHQKEMCQTKIGLHAQNLFTILDAIGSQHNRGTYMII
jgi:hypothetical protein